MTQAAALRPLEDARPTYSANIHHYFVNPKTGAAHVDADGDTLLGYYYEIIDLHGNTVEGLFGPYRDAVQAEAACVTECRRKGYI